jgi:hypothetical protein
MPSLLYLNHFKKEYTDIVPLYFKKAYRDHRNGKWEFKVEEEYPHIVTIHIETLEDLYDNDDNSFWVELRRWVERRCEGDCIIDYKNMNYKWWWNREAKSEYQKEYTDVKHGYWYLYFECESDLTMFKLMHGEKVSVVQEYHPSYGKDVLEQDKIYNK